MGITRDWISYFRAGAILTLTPSLIPATSSCWTRPTTKPCSCTRLSIKLQAIDTKLWIGQFAGAYGRYHLSGTSTVYHEAVCLRVMASTVYRDRTILTGPLRIRKVSYDAYTIPGLVYQKWRFPSQQNSRRSKQHKTRSQRRLRQPKIHSCQIKVSRKSETRLLCRA